MNPYLKLAYDQGVKQAFADAGLTAGEVGGALGATVGAAGGMLLPRSFYDKDFIRNPKTRAAALLAAKILGAAVGGYGGYQSGKTLAE